MRHRPGAGRRFFTAALVGALTLAAASAAREAHAARNLVVAAGPSGQYVAPALLAERPAMVRRGRATVSTVARVPEVAFETRTSAERNDWRIAAEVRATDVSPDARRAVLYSLVLPGLGEYYAGRTGRAKAFFLTEAAIWTTFVVFRVEGRRRESSYQDIAVTFAGVSGTGRSDEFYKTVGLYNTSRDYEAELKKDARLELYPNVGQDALDAYYLEHRLDDFEPWAWRSSARRIDYRELRSASRLAYRRSWYMVALAAANRVASAVFAYQSVRSSRAEGTSSGGYRLEVGGRVGDVAGLSFVRSF